MRFLHSWVLASLIFSAGASASLKVLSFVPVSLPEVVAPTLSDSQWRWLGQKRELTLALYGPARPPLTMIDATSRVTGYLPDFAWVVARSLGLTLRIVRFDTAAQAYSSLDTGMVDIVFSPAGDELPEPHNAGQAVEVVEMAQAYPVEVMRRSDSQPSAESTDTPLISYSPGRMLATLDQGKLSSVVLPAGEAYYLTERNYLNSLDIQRLSPRPMTAYRFVTSVQAPLLHQALQAATQNLSSRPAGEVLSSRWDQSNLVRFVSEPLNLTSEEQVWRETHPVVTVLASSFNPPFFMNGPGGQFTGIGPELLSLVSLKTGIQFRYSDIGDSIDLSAALEKSDAFMTAPLIWSRERSRDLLLTTPFMFTPTVMITRNGDKPEENIHRAVLTPALEATNWFRQAFPHAVVTLTGNPGLAMQWVSDGKADATLNTLVSARYLQQGLYQDRLKMLQGLPVPDAAIVFGVRRTAPELQGILNKTLGLVPSDMVTSILSHWQATPAARLDTWRIYRSEFYQGAAGAVILILIAAIWAVVLRRQVRRTHQAQGLLRQEILFRDRLINGPPRPVYVATPEGQIIHHNQAFKNYFSDNLSPRLSLSLFDSRHPLYMVWKDCMRTPPAGTTPLESEYTIEEAPDRERQIQHWMTSFLEDDGTTGGFIGGWHDVTEYLSMQADLQQARTEAEQANHTKSRFLATMSHEIRTPLSAIIGLLELQVQEKRADAELIRVAHESSLSLLALIGDILDIARIESGKVTLEPRWCSISVMVKGVVQAFSGLAHQKGLRLSMILPENDPEVLADDYRLRQILGNLVGNAVKFTQQGEISVNTVLPLNNRGRLQIAVQDTGPGIPAHEQDRLFIPFEQAGKSATGGSGLGLAISRELTALMEGTITLDSVPGRGSVFTVDIPVETRPKRGEESRPRAVPESHTALRILIVDDHPANRLLVSRQLALLGHNTVVADNGQTGLEAWHAEKPDVILTDCSMPVMDGREMSRRIRQQDLDVVIIGITADAQETERERCLAAGMNACLFRPVELSLLAHTLNIYAPHPPSAKEQLSDWVDLSALAAFLPDSPQAVNQFIETSISETRKDLTNAHDALVQSDMMEARRIFHRIAGTLRVSGIRELGEQCAMLEELMEMNEESAIIIHHLELARTKLEEFDDVFKRSQPHH